MKATAIGVLAALAIATSAASEELAVGNAMENLRTCVSENATKFATLDDGLRDTAMAAIGGCRSESRTLVILSVQQLMDEGADYRSASARADGVTEMIIDQLLVETMSTIADIRSRN